MCVRFARRSDFMLGPRFGRTNCSGRTDRRLGSRRSMTSRSPFYSLGFTQRPDQNPKLAGVAFMTTSDVLAESPIDWGVEVVSGYPETASTGLSKRSARTKTRSVTSMCGTSRPRRWRPGIRQVHGQVGRLLRYQVPFATDSRGPDHPSTDAPGPSSQPSNTQSIGEQP